MHYDPVKFASVSEVLAQLESTAFEVHRSVLTHANTKPGCNDEIYDSLGGLEAPPLETCVGTSIYGRLALAGSLNSGLRKALKNMPTGGAYLVDFRHPELVCRGNRVALSLKGTKLLGQVAKKEGIQSFVGLNGVQHRPKGALDTELYAALTGIAYGADLDNHKMDALQRGVQKRASTGMTPVIRIREVELSPVGIAAAVAQICCLEDRLSVGKSMSKKAAKAGNPRWTDDSDLRDFLRWQALSPLQLKSLGVAFGDGQRMLERGLVDAKHEMKRRGKKGDQVLHRDEILQFHAAELVRLNMLDYRVPFIQIR